MSQNRDYAAIGYHPSLEGGQAFGTLQPAAEGVYFHHRDQELLFPRDGLVLRGGGASDDNSFLEHPNLPGWTVYTADASFRTDPNVQSLTGIDATLAKIARRRRRNRMLVAGLVLGLVALILGLFVFKSWAVRRIAEEIPHTWEIELGEASFSAITANAVLIQDAQLQQQLDSFAGQLTSALEDTRYPFRFHIVEDPSLNAFALPGGHVVIHSGALLKARRGEEILGLLAHEIAHVNRRHSLHAIVDEVSFSILLGALIGDAGALGSVIHATAPTLNQRAYSRDNERDADLTGMSYLIKAGIDPSGPIDLFRLIEREVPTGQAGELLAFASTHPATQERIATLERAVAAEPKRSYRDVSASFANLQQALKAHLEAAD